MFHSWTQNNRINNIRELALKVRIKSETSVKAKWVCIYTSKKPTNTCYRDFQDKERFKLSNHGRSFQI